MENEIVFVPSGTGRAYWMMGDLFTFLVTGAESGGSLFALEVGVGPGHGPPAHVHRSEDEQFHVIEGHLTFRVGDRTIQASPGDYIYIPRGTVHSFKNGPSPARLLSAFVPAGIEGFFQAAGEPVLDRSEGPPPVTQETIARLLAVEAGGWKDHHETLPPPRP